MEGQDDRAGGVHWLEPHIVLGLERPHRDVASVSMVGVGSSTPDRGRIAPPCTPVTDGGRGYASDLVLPPWFSISMQIAASRRRA
jgi:hypothetical protein